MKPTLDLKRAVYVWLIPARYPSQRLGENLSWLEKHEHDRASGIYCDDNRELYLESRLWLRRLLSAATGVVPRAVRFDRSESGKEMLVRTNAKAADISFDVSYTYSCIAVALSRQGEIGVDVQRAWAMSNLSDAGSALNWNEQKHLRTVLAEERPMAASRIRAAKEAYMKTLGSVLPADHMHVTLIHGQHCTVDSSRPETANLFSMAVKADAGGKEYALALSAKDLPLVLYRVSESMELTDPVETLPAQQIAPHLPVQESQAIHYKKTA